MEVSECGWLGLCDISNIGLVLLFFLYIVHLVAVAGSMSGT